jgi:hypothetical protein
MTNLTDSQFRVKLKQLEPEEGLKLENEDGSIFWIRRWKDGMASWRPGNAPYYEIRLERTNGTFSSAYAGPVKTMVKLLKEWPNANVSGGLAMSIKEPITVRVIQGVSGSTKDRHFTFVLDKLTKTQIVLTNPNGVASYKYRFRFNGYEIGGDTYHPKRIHPDDLKMLEEMRTKK